MAAPLFKLKPPEATEKPVEAALARVKPSAAEEAYTLNGIMRVIFVPLPSLSWIVTVAVLAAPAAAVIVHEAGST